MFCPDCGTWNRGAAVSCTRCGTALPELTDAPSEKPDEELDLLRRAVGARYTIHRRIATGGMAHVYGAKHGSLGSPLVIKVLLQHLARDAEMRERFRREAEAASRLLHPHICPILDYGEHEALVYLVMPFMAGGSLADAIVANRTIAPALAASVASQVAVGLDYAHRRGIVHRDIKPDNVLFDEDGNAALTDFGIATARFHNRLTMTGRAMGTPHYMSPEQAMGKLVDGRSDVYAMGVLLYEMLVGFPPFDGADSYSIGYKHVHEMPPSPEVVDSHVPTPLAEITMKCLAKLPEERYQRGHELADALIAYLAETESAERYRTAWISRRLGITPTAS
ncbi:MAG TPA: serine/threonine-protein kinase [Gemmatimonadaceae bacterium]|jgi:serine/threonine-protein kinase|nr:serine/threonine-protein kinase [Gemmatimonadaceae bacterium]